ncbi:hypothetical protein SAMN04515665_11589 [Blastococcus sp. DSM 46786]|uniref:hypothetical protein n=1 Tax=Blastococcus sp. DSM 46786 TaxID=1798227 RepID=UPI0008B80C9F|nr:hypothetical protein [Blastococcus sp. DSM 46786]SEL61083.1 hypothetical protein SAMN04515665_11589 [Blastococcus sp. DSM 46786]
MTEGSMTGRPYGGTNDRSAEQGLPGETPEHDEVGAAPEQSPRAAQGEMSDDVTRRPADGDEPGGMADATGPQG